MKHTFAILLFMSSTSVFAQTQSPSFELSCRAKAKEIAAETYKSCVTQGRQAEVDKVRQEYQEKIKALKAQYERDLKQAAGTKSVTTTSANTTPTPSKAKEVKVTNDDSTMDIPEPMTLESSNTL
jgi:predicted Zn-dependent protease